MRNNKIFYFLSICAATQIYAFDLGDPYGVSKSVRPLGSYSSSTEEPSLQKPMGLVGLVNYALSSNPRTQTAWITAMSKAQNLGTSKSAYLPTLNASGSLEGEKQLTGAQKNFTNTKSGALTLSYTLYDFGERGANLQSAKKILEAANASQNAEVQSLFLSVVQAYFSLFGAKSSLEAYEQAEKTAKESYDAALAKYKAGTATPADKLQAMTAYSQAVLNRQKAEGSLKNSYGTLANALGLDANTKLPLIAPSMQINEDESLRSVEELLNEAKKDRPDLAAAAAQVEAAKAEIDAAKADGRPTISLSSSLGYYDTSLGGQSKSASGMLSINIPIFSGFSTTYKVKTAELGAKQKENDYAKLQKQVSLEAFTAYNNLSTQSTTVKTSRDLLSSADESLKAASGRYKAGVGNIIDLLTAQSAYASAKQQNIEAIYNWYIAKASLLQSIGKLEFKEIEQIGSGK